MIIIQHNKVHYHADLKRNGYIKSLITSYSPLHSAVVLAVEYYHLQSVADLVVAQQ